MSYELKKLTIDDFEQSTRLGMYAFRISLSDEQFEERRAHFMKNGDHRFGVFEQDQLCSQLLLHDFEFMLQGKPVLGSGVASVSTWPEYRRHGYVAKLLQQSFEFMRSKNQVVSALHPFSVSFYRKFGYELLSQRVKNTIPISQIKRVNVEGSIVREQRYIELREMYEQYAKQYDGMLMRSESFWLDDMPHKKKGNIAIYRNAEGIKRGYIIYKIEDHALQISEFVYLDKEAYDGLWSFVGQHDSMVGEVKWDSSFEDQQFIQFTEPRIKREVEQYGMGRIVDCAAFINIYKFKPLASGEEERFTLQIEDKYAPWNDGMFELIISHDGSAQLVAINSDAKLNENTLSCSINALAGLFFGYATVASLNWNGQLKGNEELLMRLNDRIDKNPTQLMDFF